MNKCLNYKKKKDFGLSKPRASEHLLFLVIHILFFDEHKLIIRKTFISLG